MMKIREGEFGSFSAIVVRDAGVMLQFYQDILGMKLVFSDTADAGVTKYYLTFKAGMLKFFAPDVPPEISTGDFLGTTGYRVQAYMVTNVTDLFKFFEEKGVQITSPPQIANDGTKWGIIADPEGNLIELAGKG